MKKILKLFSGLLLALGLAACSNDFTIAEKLLKNEHTHTFATTYTSDATHHWHAATCEHTEEVKDKAEHTFGEWTITTQPTEEAEGSKERECSVCHYKATETIAKLAHTHTFATTYTSDATHHWYAATCGHTTEVKDKAAHTFGDWTSNNDATTEADGTKSRTCSVCSYKETATDAGSKLPSAQNVATPTFSIPAGEVASGTSVTITCTTAGAKIYYTTDGSTPTASSTEYTAAISVTTAVTIKAIAVKDGMNNSVVASVSYTIKEKVATPTFSVASGAVNSGTSVTITCTTAGAKIYYTTDGSTPTASSTEYTAAISVTAAVTLKAIAVKDGMNDSAVASTSYTIAYNWYESPVDAVTGNAATSSSTYIYFGVFPKTVLPLTSSVTVDETDSITMGANTYYKGSDGEYYAKVIENCSGSSGYTYTDTTTVKQSSENSYRYFKVEPIKWKVLTTNYNDTGKALLLAEDILTANVPYYVSQSNRTIDSKIVNSNNYKYSTIRAYLNGKYESDDIQDKTAYNGKGFLQTAFTATAQSKIAETEVDNRKETTGYSESTYAANYACESTTDKIFLLSESEVINGDYNFAAYGSTDNARIRGTTDFAKANRAFQMTNDGSWWLRSPANERNTLARIVLNTGLAKNTGFVDKTEYGVVPALSISF